MSTIRPVQSLDLDQIISIENRSFSAPFTRDTFEKMIGRPPFLGFVAEEMGNIVVGYAISSVVSDEAELLTIAVGEPFRRKGIAKKLMHKMMDAANSFGVKTMFLEVRPSNRPAISLYSSLGFCKMGIRKGYYKDNGEDAIVMKKDI